METTPKRHPYSYISVQNNTNSAQIPTIDSGHLAPLLPTCRRPVASPSLFWHFWPRVAPLSPAFRFPVALPWLLSCSLVTSLSLSCRPLVAILLLPIASCCFLAPCYSLPGAFLSLSCRSPVVPSCRSPIAISCCLPVALLSLACRLPVASLSPPCRPHVASLLPNVVSCRSLVACFLLACCLPLAFLSPPCRLPVAFLSPKVLPFCSPVAFLWLACRFPVGCLLPTCRFPITFLLPACRIFGAFWSKKKRNLVAAVIFPFCLAFHRLVALKHLHYCCLIP